MTHTHGSPALECTIPGCMFPNHRFLCGDHVKGWNASSSQRGLCILPSRHTTSCEDVYGNSFRGACREAAASTRPGTAQVYTEVNYVVEGRRPDSEAWISMHNAAGDQDFSDRVWKDWTTSKARTGSSLEYRQVRRTAVITDELLREG